jgi:hypothetical protein
MLRLVKRRRNAVMRKPASKINRHDALLMLVLRKCGQNLDRLPKRTLVNERVAPRGLMKKNPKSYGYANGLLVGSRVVAVARGLNETQLPTELLLQISRVVIPNSGWVHRSKLCI